MASTGDKAALNLAEEIVKLHRPASFSLLRFLCGRRATELFVLIYAYVRWLDDVIDDPATSGEICEKLVRRQKSLLAHLYSTNYKHTLELSAYEGFLAAAIKKDRANGSPLRKTQVFL